MSPGSWLVNGTTTKKTWGQIISNKTNSNNNKFGNYASRRLSVVQNTETQCESAHQEKQEVLVGASWGTVAPNTQFEYKPNAGASQQTGSSCLKFTAMKGGLLFPPHFPFTQIVCVRSMFTL